MDELYQFVDKLNEIEAWMIYADLDVKLVILWINGEIDDFFMYSCINNCRAFITTVLTVIFSDWFTRFAQHLSSLRYLSIP